MTAEEWIRETFGVYLHQESELGPAELRFTAVKSGDFDRWLPNDPDRLSLVEANMDMFLSQFGSVINTALSLGENPVDHLIRLPYEAQRGWSGVFRLWKARGI